MRPCGSGVAFPRELELAGNGGWRWEREMRGSHDGGGSCPIYRQEGIEAKPMAPGGDWSGSGRAWRRGGGQRGRRCAWRAAWHLASRPGARGK